MVEDSERQLRAKYERLFEASQQNKQETARVYERIREINEYIRKCEESYRALETEATQKEALAAAAGTNAKKSEADFLLEKENVNALKAKAEEIGKAIDLSNAKIAELEEKKNDRRQRAEELERELQEAFKVLRETEKEKDDIRKILDGIKD